MRVLLSTFHDGPTPTTESLSAALRTALTPETRARATAVAGTIRTDGATVAAKLLIDAVGRERQEFSGQEPDIHVERAVHLKSAPVACREW